RHLPEIDAPQLAADIERDGLHPGVLVGEIGQRRLSLRRGARAVGVRVRRERDAASIDLRLRREWPGHVAGSGDSWRIDGGVAPQRSELLKRLGADVDVRVAGD